MIAWAWAHPIAYEGELDLIQRGIIKQEDSPNVRPLPPYPHWFAIADKLRISVKDLETVDPYWVMVAKVMIEAENRYRNDQDRENKP